MEKRWPHHYDALILGAMAGLAGSVVRNLLDLGVLVFLPWYRSCARLAAAIALDPHCALNDVEAYIFGLEVDFLIGIVAGVVAVLILSVWGRDRLLAKGAIGGAMTWLILFVFLSGPLSKLDLTGCFLETQISLAIHVVFGMTVVWTAWILERGKGKKDGTV